MSSTDTPPPPPPPEGPPAGPYPPPQQPSLPPPYFEQPPPPVSQQPPPSQFYQPLPNTYPQQPPPQQIQGSGYPPTTAVQSSTSYSAQPLPQPYNSPLSSSGNGSGYQQQQQQRQNQALAKFVKPEWVPDNTRTHCYNPNCMGEFSFSKRRHHCRGCGQIFCSSCCYHKTLLPVEFEYSGPEKICFTCYNTFAPVDQTTTRILLDYIFEHEGHRERPAFVGWINIKPPVNLSKAKRGLRAIALGRYRILGLKPSESLSINFHYYDIYDIQLFQAKIIIRFTKNQNRDLPVNELQVFDWEIDNPIEFIIALKNQFRLISIGMTDDMIFPIKPTSPETEKQLQALPEKLAFTDPGVAFISTYKAQCNFYRSNVNPEVFLYISDLVKNGIQDFNLNDCPGFDPASKLNFDTQPLIAALYFNQFFNSLNLEQASDKKALPLICNVIRYNRSIRKLYFSSLDPSIASQLSALGEALKANPFNNITHIDISGNDIGSRGFSSICLGLETLQHPLIHLDISNCNLSTTALVQLFDAFTRNLKMSVGIEYLNISGNKLENEGSSALQAWLMAASHKDKPAVRRLFVSNCLINAPFIARGASVLSDLIEFDLSNNRIDDPAIGQVICSEIKGLKQLRILRLSNCSLPPETVQLLMQSFFSTKQEKLQLDISSNSIAERSEILLKPLKGAIEATTNISILNLSNLKMTETNIIDTLQVLPGISGLTALHLDNTLKLKSADKAEAVGKQLAQFVTAHPELRAMSLVGSFKRVIPVFLQSFGANAALRELDISNNDLEDAGALAISISLRESPLYYLNCSNNKITTAGWKMILSSIRSYNANLRILEFPWVDYEKSPKQASLRSILLEIHELTLRTKLRAEDLYEFYFQTKAKGIL